MPLAYCLSSHYKILQFTIFAISHNAASLFVWDFIETNEVYLDRATNLFQDSTYSI